MKTAAAVGVGIVGGGVLLVGLFMLSLYIDAGRAASGNRPDPHPVDGNGWRQV